MSLMPGEDATYVHGDPAVVTALALQPDGKVIGTTIFAAEAILNPIQSRLSGYLPTPVFLSSRSPHLFSPM
jgi:hypothetical protein